MASIPGSKSFTTARSSCGAAHGRSADHPRACMPTTPTGLAECLGAFSVAALGNDRRPVRLRGRAYPLRAADRPPSEPALPSPARVNPARFPARLSRSAAEWRHGSSTGKRSPQRAARCGDLLRSSRTCDGPSDSACPGRIPTCSTIRSHRLDRGRAILAPSPVGVSSQFTSASSSSPRRQARPGSATRSRRRGPSTCRATYGPR